MIDATYRPVALYVYFRDTVLDFRFRLHLCSNPCVSGLAFRSHTLLLDDSPRRWIVAGFVCNAVVPRSAPTCVPRTSCMVLLFLRRTVPWIIFDSVDLLSCGSLLRCLRFCLWRVLCNIFLDRFVVVSPIFFMFFTGVLSGFPLHIVYSCCF